MKKKVVSIALIISVLSMISGCSLSDVQNETVPASEESQIESVQESEIIASDGVELNVVTTYAGDDTNVLNFKEAVDAWENATGNTVIDISKEASDEFKARVIDDFQNGSEPDVLFFFTGDDASEFIEEDLVVSLEEIRAVYPDYGSNMDDAKLPVAMDGEQYVIPVNGVWEGLYVNKTVLEEAGVTIPDEGYTWDQFLLDCEAIKNVGKVPIAAAMGSVPHYWFEFAVENYSGYANHLQMPSSVDDVVAGYWVNALEDLKNLYSCGYFPSNTMYAEESEAFNLFVNDQAAFLIDGSWRMNDIARTCCSDSEDMTTLDEALLESKFTVTYVPAKEARNATDLVGGCTMGYYITRSAWEDEEKRDAAVSFVQAMTTDEMVIKFTGVGAHALKVQPNVDTSSLNALQLAGYELVSGATSWIGSLIHNMNDECQAKLLENIPQVIQGWYTSETVVQNYVSIIQTQEAEALAKELEAMQESENAQY